MSRPAPAPRFRSSMTRDMHHPIQRRTFLQLSALATLAGRAQASSLKDIRIISPYPAGASVDFWARQLEAQFSTRLGVDAMVINAPGASGLIAANQARKLSSDTSPALLISGTALFSQMPRLPDSGLNFDPNQAFKPVSILWEEPYFLAVRADSPLQSLDDLLQRSRQATSAPSLGSAGANTSGGLLLDHIARRQHLAWVQVPYKGMGEITTSLLGGHIDAGLVSYQPVRQLVEAGKVRLLATTARKRLKSLPHCPSLREAKVLDIDGSVWFGLFATQELDPAVFDTIQSATAALLASESFRAQAQVNGFTPLGLTGSEARRFLRESHDSWAQVIGGR